MRTADIGHEGVLPLAFRDLLDPLPGHLVGGVVDQNVERAQLRDCPLDQRATVALLRDIAGSQDRLPTIETVALSPAAVAA